MPKRPREEDVFHEAKKNSAKTSPPQYIEVVSTPLCSVRCGVSTFIGCPACRTVMYRLGPHGCTDRGYEDLLTMALGHVDAQGNVYDERSVLEGRVPGYNGCKHQPCPIRFNDLNAWSV